MKLLYTILGLCFMTAAFQAQGQTIDRLDVAFTNNGDILKYGAIGGIKSPQVSAADLDNDGDKDLFMFDKTGNVIMTFRNNGSANTFDYTFDPSLKRNFPPLVHWALLRDFDGDGAVDIFAQLNSNLAQGVEVWKGKWSGSRLAFDRVVFPELSIGAIPIPSVNGEFTQLYISTEDIPAIEDVDDDGDMDILTFGPVGGVVYYFQNMSVENGNGTGELEYILADNCWGRFFESGISGCLELSPNPSECSEGFQSSGDDRGGVHAGSTLALFDNDGDGDKDLLLGDITFNNIVLAVNESTNDENYIGSQDCGFPSYDNPIDLVLFPAAYYVDVDNDNKRDLLVTPNTEKNGEDLTGFWFFKNINTDASPMFSFQKKDLFIDQMWDAGQGANPALVDYNADGLLDLVVGNNNYFVNGGGRDSRLHLLLNTGTATSPRFEMVDDDWLGFADLFASTPSIYNFAPTFADLDGDGDLDLFVGENSGRIIFVENSGGPNAEMVFSSTPIYDWMGLKAGQMTVPTIIDVNRDGLLDIILGEKNTNLSPDETKESSFNLFLNKGTATDPVFDTDLEAEGNNEYFGQVITKDIGYTAGQSAPAMWDTGTDFILFSGSFSGRVKVFTDVEANIDGKFTEYSLDYGELNVGRSTRLAVNDLNDDGVLDLVIGNMRGGLDFFITEFNTDGTVGVNDLPTLTGVSIYPNPADDLLHIENVGNSDIGLELYDAAGRVVLKNKLLPGTMQLNVSTLSPGVYFMKMQSTEAVKTEKIVIQ